MRPPDGGSNPATILSSVVLPQPDGPRIVVSSPSRTVSVTGSSGRTPLANTFSAATTSTNATSTARERLEGVIPVVPGLGLVAVVLARVYTTVADQDCGERESDHQRRDEQRGEPVPGAFGIAQLEAGVNEHRRREPGHQRGVPGVAQPQFRADAEKHREEEEDDERFHRTEPSSTPPADPDAPPQHLPSYDSAPERQGFSGRPPEPAQPPPL